MSKEVFSTLAIDLATKAPQAWLSAIIDSSDDAIVSKTLDGVVTTWNAGAERLFGYTSEEMVGQPILKIIPEDRHQEEPMILQRIRNGVRVDHFETIRKRKDGTLIEISVSISPVRDENGIIVGVSKIARDITLQRRLQNEISEARTIAEKAKEAAEAASRAKDLFLSVLSHELRTPLTPVLTVIGMMEKDASLSTTLKEHVQMIRRNIETEARLVDDLLDLTRIGQGKLSLHFEIVDAHELIRNVVGMFQGDMTEKGITVAQALKAKECYIWADLGRLQQIILNIISNAVKFTPPDGTIKIETSNIETNITIKISDTGVGIEPEVMPRLFNAFEQGEQTITRRFGGLGLGLSIVKSLVELHGGSVKAFSLGKDKGSDFTLTLPTTSKERDKSAQDSENADLSKVLTNRNILLVEDHADTRQIMSLLLQDFGGRVVTAASVKEAVEAANKEAFDFLLCDFGLPDGTGADVLNKINKKNSVTGIAMTGFGQEEDIRRSHEAGFKVHLTKPINVNTLQEVLTELSK